MFVDTHCHLYPSYYEDLEDIISQIKPGEIYRVINNGIDKTSANTTSIEITFFIKPPLY